MEHLIGATVVSPNCVLQNHNMTLPNTVPLWLLSVYFKTKTNTRAWTFEINASQNTDNNSAASKQNKRLSINKVYFSRVFILFVS